MIQEMLKKVVDGQDLTRLEAQAVMDAMMEGKATAAQMAALVTSLRMRGETVEELIGFAEALRSHATQVYHDFPHAVDTCGTGGDGGKTFNISTAAAFVAASAGVPIAKHGNRAVSSKSGSADVLEALGMDIQLNAKEAQTLLCHTGLCFLFAPMYHQAMKHVMPTRTELGFRTCFNLLGPLANPAGVKIQLMGVYDPALTENVACVLQALGVERALVVSGLDGLDEITVTAPTRISEVNREQITTYEVTPDELGVSKASLEKIGGGNSVYNANLIRQILDGQTGAPRDVVLLNAGAVLYIAGKAASIRDGVKLAAEQIDSGKAKEKLAQVVRYSQEVRYVS
ncbi:anthranilate phosphoribosyltransferase [Paenactinomyces guangxiensis]|uniref:Anthranilate phosphoribosyltransferase n=1 Tax=Paenactinomyces guangxiensis TaxID=1490290 RepID=A0A7W1WU53_9BACL|nr:anthranilate phosphoribosyltransferase [Paenactinomyces guangxiensis]MBA4496048.1 anthranilate phosphoribosyltransferase [Paenactinomyces guangxiensis]MBH8593136.1 anthranilate phosphoribosyltransferase [Paenactinomyces guangxiensis]